MEVESGRKADRPELMKALHLAKVTGATLVIAKLDWVSRYAAFLLALRDSGPGSWPSGSEPRSKLDRQSLSLKQAILHSLVGHPYPSHQRGVIAGKLCLGTEGGRVGLADGDCRAKMRAEGEHHL